MADAIIGKWKSDPSKTTGFKEFSDATGHGDKFPAEPEQIILEISKSGDTWTVVSQRGSTPAHTTTLKEGEKAVTQNIDGLELEIEGRIEGNKWITDVHVHGKLIRSYSYVDGNELVQEQHLDGAVLTTRFNRI